MNLNISEGDVNLSLACRAWQGSYIDAEARGLLGNSRRMMPG